MSFIRCPSCGANCFAHEQSCPECGTDLQRVARPTDSSENAQSLTGGSKIVSALMSRYRDAYLQARVTNGIGGFIKGFGIVMAILLILIGFLFISEGRLGDATFALGVITIVSGIAGGVWFYIVGVLVAAQGQILKASLDGAVNNSPFLTDEQRAKIMSLPKP